MATIPQDSQQPEQVTITPEEDARLPILEARIDRDWKAYRSRYYKNLKADGSLEEEIKSTALICVRVLHQYQNLGLGLGADQAREVVQEIIIPRPGR